jgi:hypothetical protein
MELWDWERATRDGEEIDPIECPELGDHLPIRWLGQPSG